MSFVGGAQATSFGNDGAPFGDVTVPAGVAAGDTALWFARTDGTTSPPAGWAAGTDGVANGNNHYTFGYHVLSAGDASAATWRFHASGPDSPNVSVAIYRGVSGIPSFSAVTTHTTLDAASVTMPAVGPEAASETIVRLAGCASNNAPDIVWDANVTVRSSGRETGFWCSGIADYTVAPGGTAPATTETISGGNSDYAFVTATLTLSISATGSLTLAASGADRASTGGSGSLTLTGSGAVAGPTAAGGTGTLSLSGAGSAAAPAGGSGALTLSGSGAAAAPESANAALSLSASGTAAGPNTTTGTAALNLTASAAAAAALAASGTLTLTGTATALPSTLAAGTAHLDLTAFNTPTKPVGPIYKAAFTVQLDLEDSGIPNVPVAPPTADYVGDDDSDLVTYPDPVLDTYGRPVATV